MSKKYRNMELIILGSGGSLSIPRPFCKCKTCSKARKSGIPWARTGPALYVKDANVLFDTPEEIRFQIEREKIRKIEHVFYTHWHPDHVHGLRIFEHINFTYPEEKRKKPIKVYIPTDALRDFEMIGYLKFLKYYQKNKFIKLKKVKDRKPVKIKNFTITPVNFKRKDKTRYGYLLEDIKKRKKVMYAPCSVYGAKIDSYWYNLDVLIMELGWFGKTWETRKKLPKNHNWQDHISFEENLEIIEKIQPKLTVFTHIDGTRHFLKDTNVNFLLKQENKFQKKGIKIKFAYDGMRIRV